MPSWLVAPTKLRLVFAVFAATILLSECDNPRESPVAPRGRLAKHVAALRAANPARSITTPDDLNDSIAAHVPGFGGFYVDEAGKLVVWSQDTTRGSEIRGWIHHFVAGADRPERALVVRRAAYDVRDLRNWRWKLENMLADGDWQAADVDEQTNRVFIGVGNAGAAERVVAELAAAGVPSGAVDVGVVTTSLTQTPDNRFLTSGVRPVPGGVGLGDFQYGLGGCSFGFLARPDTGSNDIVTQYYGVGASHCTATLDANDHKAWWQYEDLLLNESYEAPFTSTLTYRTCPTGKTCRYADAVLYTVPSSFTNLAWGKIVSTTDSTYLYTGGAAGTTVDTTVKPYRSTSIRAETTMGSFYVGFPVNKVGIGSGHTYGPIHRTCVDVPPFNPDGTTRQNSRYVCQMWADAYVYGGDSGAPVWYSAPSGVNILLGIVWAQTADSTGLYMEFSPIDGVHFDLGPFATFPGGSIY